MMEIAGHDGEHEPRARRQEAQGPGPEALKIVADEEAAKPSTWRRSRARRLPAENAGIIFIDEIDKIAGRETGHGPT